MEDTALVVGGGIGGLSAAIALSRAGIPAQVFERAPELREVGAGISLWPNATRLLKQWGVLDDLVARGHVFTQGEIRSRDGRLLSTLNVPASDAPAVLAHRADLHAVLLGALPSWTVHTGAAFRACREIPDGVAADFGAAGRAEGALLIGADGLWSAVRGQVRGDERPVYRGYPVWRGVAEPGSVDWPLLTETLGRGQRFGIVPIGGARVAWWAAMNEPENAPDEPCGRKAALLRRFHDWHAPIPRLIEATAEADILKNGTYDRPPVRRWGRGRVTLLGDAAHPTTPNLGQGACMAIEDAAVLAACLARDGDVPSALRAYERRRYRRTAYITRQSLQYGRIAQWHRPAAVRLREQMFRLTPAALTDLTLRRMVSFAADG